MVVVKWPEKVEAFGQKIYPPLCGGLYKEEDDSLVSLSVTDQMPRRISSLFPKRIMIGLSQGIIIMRILKTVEDVPIMVNYA